MTARLRIAVLADSHLRPETGDPDPSPWPSNRLHNDRNRAVLAAVRAARPDLVVHLGDVTHPLPGAPGREQAERLAAALHRDLGAPAVVVPGNHDIGDKPGSWAGVPPVDPAARAAFAAAWGGCHGAVEVGGVRFAWVDTPVMGSGLPEEEAQWRWLERLLADGRRTFLLLHYPPFLLEPREGEHYDNLGEPARERLLGLVAGGRVEALLCGHVHHFFFGELPGGARQYVLPSPAFVRPDTAHLARVPPGPEREHGRDDPARLGWAMLHVGADGHAFQPVRTGGRTAALAPPPPHRRCPLGLALLAPWCPVVEIPCGDLEPFRRRRLPDDTALQALLELRPARVAVPVADLADPLARPRLALLAAHGASVIAFSPGRPRPEDVAAVRAAPTEAWELVVRPEDAVEAAGAARAAEVAPVLAPLDRRGPRDHFPRRGAPPWRLRESLERARALEAGLVVRCDPELDLGEVADLAEGLRGELPRVHLLVALPGAGEASLQGSDEPVVRRVLAALAVARRHPDLPVLLDGLADKDRGYHPRVALLDARGAPRPAFEALLRAVAEGPAPR